MGLSYSEIMVIQIDAWDKVSMFLRTTVENQWWILMQRSGLAEQPTAALCTLHWTCLQSQDLLILKMIQGR